MNTEFISSRGAAVVFGEKYVPKNSSVMVLTIQVEWVFVFHLVGFELPDPSPFVHGSDALWPT